MTIPSIKNGVVHQVPEDLYQVLQLDVNLIEKWNNLTPLARNEWICWTISVKQEKTRRQHINRLEVDIKAGKKRPCCWPECPHRQGSRITVL